MFAQKTRRAAALMTALLLVPLAATAQTRVKPGFNLFTPEQDVEIGQQSAAAAQQQLPILNDAQVNAYVNNIGQRLAANAGGPQFQYQFRVVNASDINAFALPGGFIYVNRGVLDQARNEGEVAGVLAHEISHVALRHGTHQASKAYAAQAGISILSGILGGRVGQGTADIINAVGGLGLNALFLKYSRDLETQADVRGSQILAASGYSPVDMVNFFKTLERVDASKKTNWMSDHPAPPDRIARIQKEAQMLHVASNPTINTAGLQSVQARLRGYGSAPTSAQIAQGVTSGNTTRRRTGPMTSTSSIGSVSAPSSALRSYTNRSGLYRVSFPSNWQVYQEGSTGVTIAPEGGIGNIDGRTEIVYGAVINHYDPFNNASNLNGGNATLDDATNDLIAEIERDSPYLRAVNGSGQRIRMGGGSALAATLRGQNPTTGVMERVTVVTRQLADDHLLYMLFITPDRDAANYNRVLNEMVSSMQVAANAPH
jgi:beta-barrel assembly-enhancing protease